MNYHGTEKRLQIQYKLDPTVHTAQHRLPDRISRSVFWLTNRFPFDGSPLLLFSVIFGRALDNMDEHHGRWGPWRLGLFILYCKTFVHIFPISNYIFVLFTRVMHYIFCPYSTPESSNIEMSTVNGTEDFLNAVTEENNSVAHQMNLLDQNLLKPHKTVSE